jgi:hypothetical protein
MTTKDTETNEENTVQAESDSVKRLVSPKKCRKCGNSESEHVKIYEECCSLICDACLENGAACPFCD